MWIKQTRDHLDPFSIETHGFGDPLFYETLIYTLLAACTYSSTEARNQIVLPPWLESHAQRARRPSLEKRLTSIPDSRIHKQKWMSGWWF